MTEFLQLHALTSYPPANLNRDDLGRPKTAVFGGHTRLRISSQSLKRAWRQSQVFKEAVGQHKGTRTRELGLRWVFQPLMEGGCTEKIAQEAAERVARVFGSPDGDKRLIKQLVHVSPEEQAAIEGLVQTLAAERRVPTDEECQLLRQDQRAADIALFGRMLTQKKRDKRNQPSNIFNVEAAAQVAHALSVHPVTIEDDYFTAVDDLNKLQDHVGAGHVGETEFAAGLFYLYLCIDRDRLSENLQGDQELLRRTLRGLVEAVCTVAPSGKQNSFGSRAYASFVLAELGDRQPRSLSVAFLDGVGSGNYLDSAIAALEQQVEAFDQVYGPLAEKRHRINVVKGEGTEAALLDFVAEAAA